MLIASLFASTLSALPQAGATQVEVNKNTCVIIFSAAELQALAVNFSQTPSTMDRLIEKFPDQKANFELALAELYVMVENRNYSSAHLSDPAARAYASIIAAAEASGISRSEAAHLIYAAVWDEYFTTWLENDAQTLAGSRTIPQQKAATQVSDLLGFYPGADFSELLVSDQVFPLTQARIASTSQTLQRLADPYQACVDGISGEVLVSPVVSQAKAASGSSFGSS